MVQMLIRQKEEGVAILTANELDFRTKNIITTCRKEHCRMIKRPLHQEDKAILNVSSKYREAKCMSRN